VSAIRVLGARAHNLRGIDVVIPHERLTVITGPSGSGKSSLAFDVILAEAERRFLSVYLGESGRTLAPAAVDAVEGLLPALAVHQTPRAPSPRATVASRAGIDEPLAALLHRFGVLGCPRCGATVEPLARAEIVDRIAALPEGTRLTLAAPLDGPALGERPSRAALTAKLDGLRQRGFTRVLVGGAAVDLDPPPSLDGEVDLLVDRLVVREGTRGRVAESVELTLSEGEGRLKAIVAGGATWLLSDRNACTRCGLALGEIGLQTFLHTSERGACPPCRGRGERLAIDPARVIPDPDRTLAEGAIAAFGEPGSARHRTQLKALAEALDVPLGVPFGHLPDAVREAILFGGASPAGPRKKARPAYEGVVPLLTRRLGELEAATERDEQVWATLEEELGGFRSRLVCERCEGTRLGPLARSATLYGATLAELYRLGPRDLAAVVAGWPADPSRAAIEGPLRTLLAERLALLAEVGLDHLPVGRSMASLSAGEAQRIRLAEVLGSTLERLLYVLDEPTQGLHPADVAPILRALLRLRARHGTLLVVEHDAAVLAAADHVIELGPGAGSAGGRLVGEGPKGTPRHGDGGAEGPLDAPLEARARRTLKDRLVLVGAAQHNLRGDAVELVRGGLNVVAGVSGAGKSSLLACLTEAARATLSGRRAQAEHGTLGPLGPVARVLTLDERPVGRSARSTPATFLGALGPVRELFAQLPEAKARGWDAARFGFHAAGEASGRCERCEGEGVLRLAVLASAIEVECPLCRGARYERETLGVRWRGLSIADVLALPIERAVRHFEAIPSITKRLVPAARVGLGYLTLGQRASTLSGGEAQRLALARELISRSEGKTLFVLDEPTRGLARSDVEALALVLLSLTDEGHTVVVAAHALPLLGAADHVVELGPRGGEGGGKVIFAGPPADLCRADTPTGRALR
jgi:excinuclease ABC subunit A